MALSDRHEERHLTRLFMCAAMGLSEHGGMTVDVARGHV